MTIFTASKVAWDGETHLAVRIKGTDAILTLFDPQSPPAGRTHLKGEETAVTLGGHEFGIKLSPATYENLLAFDRKVSPQRRLVALGREKGVRHGLGTGNRVVITEKDVGSLGHPEALGVFEGIFRAVKGSGVPDWFIQQSIVRELIPEGVSPEDHPGLGHTGGYGPRELLRSGLFAFLALGGYAAPDFFIGADADHAIVTGANEEELQASLELNRIAIAESKDYTKFTVDTSRLFGFPVSLSPEDEKRLKAAFLGRTWEIPNILPGHPGFSYTFEEGEILALGRKYWRACQVHKELYEFIAGLKGDEPFDYELSLDETASPTEPKELLFYLVLLYEVMGLPEGAVSSAAPNLGFRKRSDYEGDVEGDLKPRTNACASILAHFGAALCIHSGSGAGIETGKGPGVDQALAEATGGHIMLKVSGIYQEILWRTLAASPRLEDRELFERAWDETHRVTRFLDLVYRRLVAGREAAEAMRLLEDEAELARIGDEWGNR
ncbi:MAG TPA: hypothetical protein ENG33_11255, partial [Chloroflexi bacterium]|nr:hypothetical protein [Chloroflexota bacterium]